MKISNVKYLDENFEWKYGDVEFDKNITAITKNDSLSESEYMLVPGFIDIHSHGCGGFDTCDNDMDGYKAMSAMYAKNGVTSWLMTTMTTPKAEILKTLNLAKEYIEAGDFSAYPQGIYLEGPFISMAKKGAQSATNILAPSMDTFMEFYKASGENIKAVICAPEEDGALEFAREASKICRVSVAHTDASYEETMAGFEAGFSSVTHLYNAMTQMVHREPGVVGAALSSDCYSEIICDGIHVHPAVVKATFNAKSADRILLISDSTQAAGMPDGQYMLGGQKVYLVDGVVKLADGVIAGSATRIISCVQNCISWGIPSEVVFRCASMNQATYLGVEDKTGSIKEGKLADLVLLDKDLNVVKTFVMGREIVG